MKESADGKYWRSAMIERITSLWVLDKCDARLQKSGAKNLAMNITYVVEPFD
jgi:hypothetical protein